jgi:hypothetical protein
MRAGDRQVIVTARRYLRQVVRPPVPKLAGIDTHGSRIHLIVVLILT